MLKLGNCVQSGGEAKMLIAAGQVKVNNQVEIRKRCQMKAGDIVAIDAGPTVGPRDRDEFRSILASPERTHSRSASAVQPVGNSACSISMSGISSLIENRGPQRVQTSVLPSAAEGPCPSGRPRAPAIPRSPSGRILTRGIGRTSASRLLC